MRRLASFLFLLTTLVGCGGLPWNFESLSLEEKVAAYEKYLQGRGHPKIRAQAQISWHGWPAADLMSEYLNESREGLPVHEALEIIYLVQTRGCPLRGTAAEREVRSFLAREPHDTVEYLVAKTTLYVIEQDRVMPGDSKVLKDGPCEEARRQPR